MGLLGVMELPEVLALGLIQGLLGARASDGSICSPELDQCLGSELSGGGVHLSLRFTSGPSFLLPASSGMSQRGLHHCSLQVVPACCAEPPVSLAYLLTLCQLIVGSSPRGRWSRLGEKAMSRSGDHGQGSHVTLLCLQGLPGPVLNDITSVC